PSRRWRRPSPARSSFPPPPPPLRSRSPSSRVHSRSRSPGDSVSAPKRLRGSAAKSYIVMGPIQIPVSATPIDVFRFHMTSTLATYRLPADDAFSVTMDPLQANHLRISTTQAAEARALAKAWARTENNAVTMEVFGPAEDVPHRQVGNSAVSRSGGGHYRTNRS
ncbi:hypothetical protein C8R46DRAFT_1309172, partial [Mycena filopes]